MSWQMDLLVAVSRHIAKPNLARVQTPEEAAEGFDRGIRFQRRPPFVLHLVRPVQDLDLHWIACGAVRRDKVILYLHGGAYMSGSPLTHMALIARLSRLTGIEVCAPAYRLLQQAPFPAPFEDARAAWDHLMRLGYAPGDVVLGGDSAGGGLMLALLADLCARGQAPAAAFALSPWTDLTLSGESLSDPREAVLPVERIGDVIEAYLGDADPADPRASPLFARFRDPPPVLFQHGTEEALRDDTLRMAARLNAAGGEVVVSPWPRAPHVWQIFDGWLPESRAALREVAAFVQTSLARDSR